MTEVLVDPRVLAGEAAGQSVLGEGAHELLLVEDRPLAAEEGKLSGDELVEQNVGQTHVEDLAVVGGVGVVAVGQIGAVKAGDDVAEDEAGVGRELERVGEAVPAVTEPWQSCDRRHENWNQKGDFPRF